MFFPNAKYLNTDLLNIINQKFLFFAAFVLVDFRW